MKPVPSDGNYVHKPFTNLLQTVQHFESSLRYYIISSRNILKHTSFLSFFFFLSPFFWVIPLRFSRGGIIFCLGEARQEKSADFS